MKIHQDILGWDLEKVLVYLHEIGADFRITEQDGICFCITDDLVPDRYNLHVEKGIVTKVYFK